MYNSMYNCGSDQNGSILAHYSVQHYIKYIKISDRFLKLHFQVILLPHGCINTFMFLQWGQERERKGKRSQLCFCNIFFLTTAFLSLAYYIPTFETEYQSISSSWLKCSSTQSQPKCWYTCPLHRTSSAGDTGHGGHLKHLPHLSHGFLLWSPQLLNYSLTLLHSTCATLWQSQREAVKQSLLTWKSRLASLCNRD